MTTEAKPTNRVETNGEANTDALSKQECGVLTQYCDLAIRQGGREAAPLALHLISKLEALAKASEQ